MSDAPTGMILAAGRGSRLGALTDARPKCLVELAGRPLLSWQIGALAEAGLERVVVVTGYQSHLIERLGVETVHAPRWAETNMVSTLLEAFAAVEPPYVVSYSDIVYPAQHVGRLLAADGELRMTYDRQWQSLWESRFDDPLDDAETFRVSDGLITEIGGVASHLGEIEGQFMGLTYVGRIGRQWILDTVASDASPDELDSTTLLQHLISAGRPIHGVAVDGGWAEVDSERDLAVASSAVSSGSIQLSEVEPW